MYGLWWINPLFLNLKPHFFEESFEQYVPSFFIDAAVSLPINACSTLSYTG